LPIVVRVAQLLGVATAVDIRPTAVVVNQ
jgi:hypothetical protein